MTKFVKICIGIILPAFLIFLLGLGLGVYIRDFPFFEIDRKIGIADLANLLLTIVVAFLIPISLSPIITNKRTLKDFLISETKDCIALLLSIKQIIDSAAHATTTKKEKTVVNGMIGQDLGLKVNSLVEQLKNAFPSKSKNIRDSVNQSYLEYWRETTGGNLMSDKFSFSLEYSHEHNRAFARLEATLKLAIFQINNI